MRQLHTLAIAAAVLAAACTDNANDIPAPASSDGSTTIRAIHATTTRTDFDGTASSWTEGDAMSVIIAGGDHCDAGLPLHSRRSDEGNLHQ